MADHGDWRRSAVPRAARELSPRAKAVVAGSVGGVASTFVCHPLDTIRTRMQTSVVSGRNLYRGAWDCFRQTVRAEGVGALYKGLAGPIAAQALYKAVMFGTFGQAQARLVAWGVTGSRSKDVSRSFMSGMVAGSVNALFVCPIELVRNRLMVQRNGTRIGSTGGNGGARYFSGPIDCVRQTVRSEPGGVLSLWKGLSSTILRDGPGVGMWFGCFTLSKMVLSEALGVPETSGLLLLTSGALGGVGFWLVALPFDTIKSHVQTTQSTAGRGGGDTLVQLARRLSLGDLYTGLSVAVIRGIPGAGMVFLVQSKTLEALG